MITDLNKKVKAKSQGEGGMYKVLPVGDYNTKVKSIEAWKPLTKDIMVNKRTDSGWLEKDENDKIVKEFVKDYTFYVCAVVLTVIDGEYEGQNIHTSLTTHPNATFITEGFLYACKEDEIPFGQIQDVCVGKTISVLTKIDTYTKKKVDKDTGIEEKEVKETTRVDKFNRYAPTPSESDELDI